MPRPSKSAISAEPTKPATKPPYPFVLDALAPLDPEVRRMFSGFAIYSHNLLILMLRDHATSPRDNGIWLVLSETTPPHDPTLRRDFPSLRRIELLGDKINHWLLIPSDSPTFESESLHACDLLLRRDPAWAEFPNPAANAKPLAVRAGPVKPPNTPKTANPPLCPLAIYIFKTCHTHPHPLAIIEVEQKTNSPLQSCGRYPSARGTLPSNPPQWNRLAALFSLPRGILCYLTLLNGIL